MVGRPPLVLRMYRNALPSRTSSVRLVEGSALATPLLPPGSALAGMGMCISPPLCSMSDLSLLAGGRLLVDGHATSPCSIPVSLPGPGPIPPTAPGISPTSRGTGRYLVGGAQNICLLGDATNFLVRRNRRRCLLLTPTELDQLSFTMSSPANGLFSSPPPFEAGQRSVDDILPGEHWTQQVWVALIHANALIRCLSGELKQ